MNGSECLSTKRTCRLCLCRDGAYSNIFDDDKKLNGHSLIECIQYIKPIKIDPYDGLPKLICHNCNYLVEQCFEFCIKIEESYEFLSQQRLNEIESVKEVKQVFDENVLKKNDIDEVLYECEYLEEDESLFIQFVKENDPPNVEQCESSSVEEDESLSHVGVVEPTSVIQCTPTYVENVLLPEEQDKPSCDDENNENQECPLCLKFIEKSLLDHLKEHTDENICDNLLTGNYVCTHCGYDFHHKDEFLIHWRNILNIHPYRCGCSPKASFVSQTKYNDHIQQAHTTDDDEHIRVPHDRLKCNFCDAKFSSIIYKRKHERRHRVEGHLICHFCGQKFYSHSELNRHLQMHTGELLYPCLECPKKYKSNSELKRHTNYHKDKRLFSCAVCDKRFLEAGHLKQHFNVVHFNMRSHQCSDCNKSFPTASKLKRHRDSHIRKMEKQLLMAVDNRQSEQIDSNSNYNVIEVLDENNEIQKFLFVHSSIVEGGEENDVNINNTNNDDDE